MPSTGLGHDVCVCVCVCVYFLDAQTVKSLPAVQETRVLSLSWEDPREKEMATHSSILTWKTPWTEEPGDLQSIEWQRVGHDRATSLSYTHTHVYKYVCACMCLTNSPSLSLMGHRHKGHPSSLKVEIPSHLSGNPE